MLDVFANPDASCLWIAFLLCAGAESKVWSPRLGFAPSRSAPRNLPSSLGPYRHVSSQALPWPLPETMFGHHPLPALCPAQASREYPTSHGEHLWPQMLSGDVALPLDTCSWINHTQEPPGGYKPAIWGGTCLGGGKGGAWGGGPEWSCRRLVLLTVRALGAVSSVCRG